MDVVVYMNKPGAQPTLLQIFCSFDLTMTTAYNQPSNQLTTSSTSDSQSPAFPNSKDSTYSSRHQQHSKSSPPS